MAGEEQCLGVWERVPCGQSPAPGLAQAFEQRGHLVFLQKQVPWEQLDHTTGGGKAGSV